MTKTPDWLAALNARCDAASNAAVARELGLNPSTISQIRRGVYGASTDSIAQLVRGRYMAEAFRCPALGFEITSDRCRELQRGNVSAPPYLKSALRVTCPGCEHNLLPKKS
jgi:DNA-binding transcriptional regulator YdaS (Cro superfamily)